ncbi:flagellar biosynthesis protein FlhB [Paenibacillus thiaminolyticus]|uniref:Flagellar biosynthetic protein FlhB n=1 Tax=Paenibacillus thiaminolyticus TaxID=49283 RepID=A0AAP9E1M4_PANTH|nr:flagellar biosynthesis protein FlhB [Paenibacillus thiaminolyticus]MCY9538633.1 flagellar biosynthesis protein FlhB [Paenibacillus thiaminolyticus]MCY9603252.1 flagellar biosynthesis protein FlhB [Paenibacillus thiaminolyticus]MCY9609755.1 flagellar biosynthesis protein FlhB [Paenibacillus thiaminolyticus]MCY9613699.1 flagellar biosynthesis protein FlhB [Paenibacillus thiaminolyticus]MCY9618861.1 flagellar biosynthesis protein FlhB [Paenibacillus thiaminolyticus]
MTRTRRGQTIPSAAREYQLRHRLNLQLFSQEKTEKATPKKRQESRKKGQVAKSSDLSGASILLACFFCLLMFGSFYKERVFDLFADSLQHRLTMNVTIGNVTDYFSQIFLKGLIVLAPVFLAAFLMGLIANYAQIGFLFTGEPMKMKLSKINPIQGFKRIFSLRSVVEFLKSILKLAAIAVIVYLSLWGERDRIVQMSHVPLNDILSYTAQITLSLGLKIGAALFAIAIMDYMYQRYDHEKSMRMSKQDIKDEYKKTEGDPLIKGKIKERQRRMAMMRMMQEVPKADVIITNPTHFAVALKYDGSEMEAPQVIAKGQDYVALRIKQIAKENGVLTMENKPLARALFERTEIGEAIPADLFQAVAEVLAYVYKLKGKVN